MITSGFFNSIDGDRRYRAEDFANYFNSIVSTGVFEDTVGNLSVSPSSGMSVAVAPGKAFINGYCMISNSAVSMTIPAAHASLDRIDRIAVRLDLAGRAMNIVLLSGTPSGTATPPELTRNSGRYELCLADISIPAGTTSITSALITDTRSDANLCGGVLVKTADLLALEGKADKSQAFDYGDIKLTARANAPAGWIICDGRPVSRTAYPELFAAISVMYGVGDGSTTFNVPNLCGRVPAGFDSTQTEFNNLGKTGGEKAHANTAAENGPHAHEVAGVPVLQQWRTAGSTGFSCETTTTLVTKSSGLGTPHNNLQPYITLNYIIFAGQEG